MANEVSTAGLTLKYAVESTAGTRPTTGYQQVARIKSVPDLNPTPGSIDVTDLSDLEWKRSIPGLKDVGGAVAFKANNTDEFQTGWAAIVSAWETAQAASGGPLAMWFELSHPRLAKAFYFAGQPSPLGLSAAEVDAALEIDAYITPNQVAGWATKST